MSTAPMRCTFCNGRTVKTEAGRKCMNSSCEGAKGLNEAGDSVNCPSCNEVMSYRGLTGRGEPKYVCPGCGKNVKL